MDKSSVGQNFRMSSLHCKIEAITGLKSSQQRIMYCKRLISYGCASLSITPGTNANANTSTNETTAAEAMSSNLTAGMLPSKAGRSVSATSATILTMKMKMLR